MTLEDILSVADSIITKPPDNFGWAATMAERRFASGQTVLDGWREEIKTLLTQIADEGSWQLQKFHLLKLYLRGARWNAVCDVVEATDEDCVVWHEWVHNLKDFQNEPRDTWRFRIAILHMYAAFNTSVLAVVGTACFGVAQETMRLANVYQKLEQEGHEKNIAFNEGLLLLAQENPEIYKLIHAHYAVEIEAVMKAGNDLMRSFADSICTERVDAPSVGSRWAEIAKRQNAVILKIRAELDANTEDVRE